jgi:hypothetical protein
MSIREDSLVARIASLQDFSSYRDLSWEGSFEEYLRVVRERPQVTRNAFQRLYDMIVSYGEEEYVDNKKRLVRHPFFQDPIDGGKDAIFGLDIPLMRLVSTLQAAALGLRPREAHHPAPRPGRLEQEHDRAPAQEGHRALLAHAGGRPLHLQVGEPEGDGPRRRSGRDAVPDERGAAASSSRGVARQGHQGAGPRQRRASAWWCPAR